MFGLVSALLFTATPLLPRRRLVPSSNWNEATTVLAWPLVYATAVAALAFVYRFAPNRHTPRARVLGQSRGRCCRAVVDRGAVAFSFYAGRFGRYDRIYGPLGAVVVLMLWFYLTGYAILVGAELDAAIERLPVTPGEKGGRSEPRGVVAVVPDNGRFDANTNPGEVSMRSRLLNVDPPITYAVVFDIGEEVAAGLGRFVREKEVEAASVTAIGGFRDAVLGYFDWSSKEYEKIRVDEQVEVLSLLGDVAVAADGPSLHLHAVLGRRDGSVVGGHLIEAHVRPTLEVILIQPPSYLQKRRDPITGLPLLALD